MPTTSIKRKRSRSLKRTSRQRGGASTDYSALFYSQSMDPASLSRYTLQRINDAPVFNPLSANTRIPTPSLGPVATASYLASQAPARQSGGSPSKGKKRTTSASKTNPWITHVNNYAKIHGISYREAMSQAKKDYNPTSNAKSKAISSKATVSRNQSGGQASAWIAHVKAFAKAKGIKFGDALRHAQVKQGYSSSKSASKTASKSTSRKQSGGANKWIAHVKAFATQKGINYREALQHPQVKQGYIKI
jgi:hypothetical protein